MVYGGGQEPISFKVNERVLRHALADAGAVINLDIEGGEGGPVVVKEVVKHPVTSLTMHVDLLRVDLSQTIQTTVALELTGAEEAEGVRLGGGILEQPLRELNIEALPERHPGFAITHDVTEMQIGDTLTLDAITAPAQDHVAGRSRDRGRHALRAAPADRGRRRDRAGDRGRRRGRVLRRRFRPSRIPTPTPSSPPWPWRGAVAHGPTG